MKPNPRIPARTPESTGFTLVEMLIVMGLIGILMGTGVGLLAGIRPGERAVAGLVQQTARLAQRSSMIYAAPSRLLIDPEASTISAQVLRTVGTWHFEEANLMGGAQLGAVWMGKGEVPLTKAGFQGNALELSGAQGVGQLQISVQDDGAFDWTEGFSLRCAVRVDAWKPAVLLRMGQGLIVTISGQGALGAEFLARTVGEDGRASRGARIRVETEADLFQIGVWRMVEVVYDRTALSIYVDGIERVRRPEQAQVWMNEARIWISDPKAPFPGAIDSLVVAVQDTLPPRLLPGDALFHPECPRAIVFAPGGALDPLVHSAPVSISWVLPDGTEDSIRIALQGSVQ